MKLRIGAAIAMVVFATNASGCNNFMRSSHPKGASGISISVPTIQALLSESIERADRDGVYADYPVNDCVMSPLTSLFYQDRDLLLIYGKNKYQSSDSKQLIEIVAALLKEKLSSYTEQDRKEHFAVLQGHLRASAKLHNLKISDING